MIRAALATALSIALCACVGTARRAEQPPASHAPQAAAEPAPSVPALPDPRVVMVDLAASMLGQPYRFGGAAPGGFDCSGLVEYAAGGAGISLPRTAQEQLRAGAPVARGDVQMGDLVFMHLEHKELHVGIAIDGERFIHAPSTGGHVRIDSLTAFPYAQGFLSARRIAALP